MRALLLCALVACTYPEKEFDGPFTCFGAPPPTTADPLVNLAGTTIDPQTKMPVGLVTVALQDAQMSTIFTATSDINGRFTIPLNTNGTPVVGIDLFASAVGRINSYYFPWRPITQDLDIVLSVLSTTEASALVLGAGVTMTPGDGTILLSINDCNEGPISGATLASSPAGTVRYFMGIQPLMMGSATDPGGVAMVANLAPGNISLTATVGTMTLPSRNVKTVADSFTLTEIQP
jgi:hypothetical protein